DPHAPAKAIDAAIQILASTRCDRHFRCVTQVTPGAGHAQSSYIYSGISNDWHVREPSALRTSDVGTGCGVKPAPITASSVRGKPSATITWPSIATAFAA